jgi:hypothetical protein
MAVLGSILGLRVDDARIRHSLALAREQGVTMTFEEVLDPEKHPVAAVIVELRADRHVTDVVAIPRLGVEYERTEED